MRKSFIFLWKTHELERANFSKNQPFTQWYTLQKMDCHANYFFRRIFQPKFSSSKPFYLSKKYNSYETKVSSKWFIRIEWGTQHGEKLSIFQ